MRGRETATEAPHAPAAPPVRAMLPVASSITDEDVAAAASDRAAAAKAEQTPALVVLADRLGLSGFERDVLLLCAAMELDPGTPTRCADVHDNPQMAHPTFAMALAVLPEPTWDALSPQRPLRYWRLIEMSQAPAQPLTTSQLRADERIVSYLKGLNGLDDRLETLVTPVRPAATEPPPSHQSVVAEVVMRFRDTAPAAQLPVVQLLGADARSKADLAARAAGELSRHLFRLSADVLPTAPDELDTIARLWHRESVLLSVALYLDAQELDEDARTARWPGSWRGPRGSSSSAPARRAARSTGRRSRSTFPAPRQPSSAGCGTRPSRGTPARTSSPPSRRNSISLIRLSTTSAARSSPRAPPRRAQEKVWDECLGAARARDSTPWPSASTPRPAGRTSCCPTARDVAPAAASPTRSRHAAGCTRTGASPRAMSRGLGISVLFAGAERHGQDDGRRGARQRPAPGPLPHRPVRRRQQVHRRDGEEPARGCSTPPRTAARSCSSTRRTRCSASAARSRTATTATPTSRSTTCCSAWRRYRRPGDPGDQHEERRWTRRSCAACASSVTSRSPIASSGGRSGSASFRRPRRSRGSTTIGSRGFPQRAEWCTTSR